MPARAASRTLVVDSSAAINAALVADAFKGWSGVRLTAPTLMWSEAASGLSQMHFRSDLTRVEAHDAMQRLLALPIESVDSRELVAEAVALAQELGWAKSYDAEYVVLARRLGVPLLTVDARLRGGVRGVAEIVSPADVDSWR